MATSERQLEQLTAYLDGELSDKERAKVEAWLEEDEQARALLDELRQTTAMVSGLPRMQAPEHLADDVAERIERAALLGEESSPLEIRSRRSSGWGSGLALAASIALVVTAGWYMWPDLRDATNQSSRVFTLAEAPDAAKPNGMKSAKRGIKGDPAGAAPTAVTDLSAAEEVEKAPEEPAVALAVREIPQSPQRRKGEKGGAAREPEQRRGVAAEEEMSPAEGKKDARQVRPLARGDGTSVDPVLTNAGIRQLNARNASNVLVVETDAKTQQDIVAYLNTFVTDNRIPDATSNTFEEPIPPTQRFYVDEGNALSEMIRDEESPTPGPAREVRVVFNAPAEEVQELLTSVNRIRSDNRAQMNWTANSLRVEGDDVQAAMALLRPDVRADRFRETLLAFDNARPDEAKPAPATGKSAGVHADDSKQAGMAESAEDTADSSAEEVSTTPPPAPAREKARPGARAVRGRGAERVTSGGRAAKASPPSEPEVVPDREKGSRSDEGRPESLNETRLAQQDDSKVGFGTTQPAEKRVPPFIQIAMVFRTLSESPTDTAPAVDAEASDAAPGKPRISRPHPPSSSTSQPTSQGAPRG